jgi:multiple sugar transport system substrate-binding protein
MIKPTRRGLVQAGLGAAMAAPLMFTSRSPGAADSAASANSLPKFSKLSMLIDTSAAGKAWQGGMNRFNEIYNGRIEVGFDSTDFSTLLQKETLLFFSGSAQYDVLPVNGEWTAALQNYLLPLDPFLEADGLDAAQLFGAGAAFSAGGQIVGLPARNAPNVYAYRKDLYAERGLEVPTTIEEWAAQVPKLTTKAGDGRIQIYGTSIAEGASAPHFSSVMVAYYFYPHGLRILAPDLQGPDPSLKSDAAVHILSVLQEVAAKGDTPNQLGWSYTDTVTAWQQGSMATSAIFGARSQAMEDPAKSVVRGKVGYELGLGIPTAKSPLAQQGPHKPTYFAGPWYLTINGKTRNPRAAWELVKFIAASEEGQKLLASEYANQPTLLSVLSSPEYQARDPAAATTLDVYSKYGWLPIAPVPQNANIALAIHKQVQELFSGKDPKSVAVGMHDDVGSVLKS